MKLFEFFVVAAAAEITHDDIKAVGHVGTVKAAKDACAAIGPNWQLPVPTTEAYNNVLSSWSFSPGSTNVENIYVPLGISDIESEGDWINIYTSEYTVRSTKVD